MNSLTDEANIHLDGTPPVVSGEPLPLKDELALALSDIRASSDFIEIEFKDLGEKGAFNIQDVFSKQCLALMWIEGKTIRADVSPAISNQIKSTNTSLVFYMGKPSETLNKAVSFVQKVEDAQRKHHGMERNYT